MDHWNRNVIENRVEQWREQRAQKMAARLQLNSSKPRTISSNVLGYVNYRQPVTVQPGYRQHHGEGPSFSHVDQRWNSNYNYSGYREHHAPHNQYHHIDQRNHGYGHGLYRQQWHGQKKGGHFSSHKSLHNDRKLTNKPNKRFSSSCSSINNTKEVEIQNVVSTSEQTSGIGIKNPVPSDGAEVYVNKLQVNSNCSKNVTAVVEDVVLSVTQGVEKVSDSDEKIQEGSVPKADRLQDNINEAVETIQTSGHNENNQLEPLSHVGGSVPTEEDIVSNISVLKPVENCSEVSALFVDGSSTITSNIENSNDITVVDNEAVLQSLVEVNDHKIFIPSIESQSINIAQEKLSDDTDVKLVNEPAVTDPENIINNYRYTDVNCSEILTNVEKIIAIEQIVSSENNNDTANENLALELNLSYKPEIQIVVEDEVVDPLELNAKEVVDLNSTKDIVTNVEEILSIEQVESYETNSSAANENLNLELNFKPEMHVVVEDTDEAVDPLEWNAEVLVDSNSNKEIVTNVEEILVIERVESYETNSSAAYENLNLNFKPEMHIVVEDKDEAVDPLELNAEVVVDSMSNEQSNNEGIGGSYAGTSFNENADVFPVALLVAGDSDTEASIIRYDDISSEGDNDLSKEIECVENQLANISIANKDDVASDKECFTPMKRERQHVLLDATNILQSSTVKFAVREVRKNDVAKIIVTPVRRSARLSTRTENEIIVTPVRRSSRLSTRMPVSAHKNVCVQKLEELSPEVLQKMKLVQNPAMDYLSEG